MAAPVIASRHVFLVNRIGLTVNIRNQMSRIAITSLRGLSVGAHHPITVQQACPGHNGVRPYSGGHHQGVRLHSGGHQCVRPYSGGHQSVRLYSGGHHQGVRLHSGGHQCVRPYSGGHQSVRLYSGEIGEAVDESCQESCHLSSTHTPVMTEKVLDYLFLNGGSTFLDMTLGAGGHSEAILRRHDDAVVYGLDRDPVTLKTAHRLNEQYGRRFHYLHGRFSQLESLLNEKGVTTEFFDGALLDVGASSMQFDSAVRGFSLTKDGPLDMRMDWTKDDKQPSAADVVNGLYEDDLYSIIKKYGEEKRAKKIARAIVQARGTYGRIKTTKQLAEIIANEFGEGVERRDKLSRYSHPATKTFQALRIFVNNELNELNNGLLLVHKFLKPGGICSTISFHSLEDRIIKETFNRKYDTESFRPSGAQRSLGLIDVEELEKLKLVRWEPINRKVVEADIDEVARNPRSRSAKLRAARKI